MVLSGPRDRPPVALWVLPVADLAGVARHALDVARVGIPGWRLAFLVPEGAIVARLRALDAEVHVARFGPEHGLRASAGALRRTVARVRPDLVHGHLSYADGVAALALPRRTRLVTTEHGIADDDLVYHGSRARSRARAVAHRARLRRTDALIAVSAATLRVARAKWHPPAGIPQHVVLNGIDPPADPPPTTPGLHVASLSRLAPEKRLDDLVASFAILAARRPDARLTVAGVGELEDDLRAQVAALGLADRVDFPGHVDPVRLLARVDVVAQLSVWENCSYTLLDAVAHGRGVVASPVGGNLEILPEQCLADPADHERVADTLVHQGLQTGERPRLAAGWPGVAAMGKEISEVYAEVTDR